MRDLSNLIARVRSATGPDRELDALIWLATTPGATRKATHVDHWHMPYDIDETRDETGRLIIVPSFTAFLDDAVALCNRVLPGWWWRVGTCHVSDDATIGPDYNSPEHGERLHREFPIGVKDDGYPDEWIFDVDQRPPRSVALALILAVLLAKQEIEQ